MGPVGRCIVSRAPLMRDLLQLESEPLGVSIVICMIGYYYDRLDLRTQKACKPDNIRTTISAIARYLGI